MMDSRKAVPALALLVLLASCANPVMPTGGPADQTPPALLETVPAAEAVNVTPETIRLVFSEYVDTGSFVRALSITPEIGDRIDYRWKRRSVELSFTEPLRDSTTYILTIDTNLRDAHGVSLTEPLTLAFSTGPEINRGQLAGSVVEPTLGRPVSGLDVYAYPAPDGVPPDSLPPRPAYRTQTDDQGRFTFSYLREQPYYVIAVADANRNRRPDATERFAVPPRATLPALAADSMAAGGLRWITTRRDTLPPKLQRVRALSRTRLEVRFDDAVQVRDRTPESWALVDSTRAADVAVRSVYMLPDDPRLVFLETDLLAERPYLLTPPPAIADSAGNPVRPEPVRFVPVAGDDTLQVRFRGFLPTALRRNDEGRYRLLPGMQPGVRFNQPIDSLTRGARLTVVDTAGTPLAFTTSTDDGTGYTIALAPPLGSGRIAEVQVRQPRPGGTDTLYTRVFQRISADALGGRSGIILAADTTGSVVVELLPPDGAGRSAPYVAVADASGAYAFEGLPEGSYLLRAFVDRNANRRWDGGAVLPYRPPEPITWVRDSLNVRPRWDTAAPDTLRIPTL